MKIALVGATGSLLDISCLAIAYGILKMREKPEISLIDLRYGRDFLREEEFYDIVTVIYVFRFRPEELMDDVFAPFALRADPDTYRTSALHCREKWRSKLSLAGPQHILLFGGWHETEVTADYIGSLPGYTLSTTGCNGRIDHYIRSGDAV